MVVKGAVKLAHIVCAVFSLSRPRGATRAQIFKFCKLRFRVRRDRRLFDHALERAEDEGLVTCFQQRYYLRTAASGSDILWSLRQKRQPRATVKPPSSRTNRKREAARRVRRQRNKNNPSICSFCNLEKRRREGMKRRKSVRNKSRLRDTKRSSKGVILCKSFTSSDGYKPPWKRCVRRSSRVKNKTKPQQARVARRNQNRSRQELRGKRKCAKNKKKRRVRKMSRAKKSCKKRSRREKFRESLERPRRTVAHAESWDRINYSQRRLELENLELMRDSRLVQRILSRRHGPSWDDMNKELRRIKSSRSRDLGGLQARW